MWNQNKFTQMFGLQWPVIQGPFGGGLSSVELSSTVSNLGGLGSFGAHYMTPEQIESLAAEFRTKTRKPFAINLWVSDHDPEAEHITPSQFEEFKNSLKPYYDLLKVPSPTFPKSFGEKFDHQVEAVLKAKPPVFSFVFGIPSKEVLAECRRQGILTIGTAVTVEEALALDDTDVDAIVVSGFEAGGHRGAFLKRAEESLMGTFSLIPQTADRIRKPLIAAGGITDGRGIAAALILGAQGAQIGTAFLACDESNANQKHKDLLRSGERRPTQLTRAFSGRLARGIENKMMRDLAGTENKIAPYPVQTWLTKDFKTAPAAQGTTDYMALWASQSYPQVKHTGAATLMNSLIKETDLILSTMKGTNL
ncbi:NAD(P)H-dependent flavin oxidoreductase [Bdellovibrio bacteriovorus]|uniref:NAD(P)H-dependent flavin oxidoreductase n=1 Tax=Bdellovibrio TaxID=958 RepID=UPI0035A8F046